MATEEKLAYARRWRKDNKDRTNEYGRDRYHRNLEESRKYYRDRNRRRRMGAGADEKADELLVAQGGKCAICFSPDPNQLDHCHDTGKIRGVLCVRCNLGLGAFADDPTLLEQAIEYLTRQRS
jgi:hypothetical protein